ncbi:hypothetical protein U9M48_034587 [Paspalum notatum var. saurae]|uniref:Uncharacterized protein n=1 Tax=Paspalum notatum var. saurae TaxID=547442 RepID=A0AAQ3UDB8_PASNO
MAAAGLLLLPLCASINLASSSKDCHAADKAALLAIKSAFTNSSYLSSAWDSTAAPGLLRVLARPAIAGLAHLRALTFFKVPGVSGPIPSSLADLSKTLTTLTISRTGVSGPIPSALGAWLPALHELDLSFNALAGAIPPSLAAARNLTVLDLSRNRLSGAIPPHLFSGFVPSTGESGVYLALSHNNLSGAIPARFAGVSYLGFDVSRNKLTGDASPVLSGAGRPLRAVNLARNAFSFDLSRVEFPEDVEFVDLSHNAVYGGVPAASRNCSSSTSATTCSAARSRRGSAGSTPTASSTTSASALAAAMDTGQLR